MVSNKGVPLAASPNPKPILKSVPKLADPKPKLGLRAWMERVLEECDRAEKGFDADAVHDLRVALRRCRSLADGLRAIDPDPSWKQMKKAGRKVFQALGELRDMQVMQEWIEKLEGNSKKEKSSEKSNYTASAHAASANQSFIEQDSTDSDSQDTVVMRLLDHLHAREIECKQDAFKDLNEFDRKQWRQWSRSLPRRAARVRPGSLVYLHLALEKWTAAYDLHKHALRSRSTISWHALRIGIKRFRYTVENFLPRQHAQWGDDLKELQDLLGEVHDLDVLWATAQHLDHKVYTGAFPDADSRNRWRTKLTAERSKRITRYREKMVGKHSLWRVWRAELPSGPQLHAAAISRLRTWAGYLDPDFAHSQRVAQLAFFLYDGLQNAGLLIPDGHFLHLPPLRTERAGVGHLRLHEVGHPAPTLDRNPDYDPRTVLQAAALMHDVGKIKGSENHHKVSYRMIRGLERPLGWSARELELAATVARYHRGALPNPRGKKMQQLELADRPVAMELAGVLRLANALDTSHRHRPHNAGIPRLEVVTNDSFVIVRVAGYSALDRSAEEVAAARHLLETVLRRPVLVRPLRTSGVRSQASNLRKTKANLSLVKRSLAGES
jgi:CHAD domain-containing protein